VPLLIRIVLVVVLVLDQLGEARWSRKCEPVANRFFAPKGQKDSVWDLNPDSPTNDSAPTGGRGIVIQAFHPRKSRTDIFRPFRPDPAFWLSWG
jgi:hypothetical protein